MRDGSLAQTPVADRGAAHGHLPEEPRNLAEELDLPEQLDDDEGAAPAGGPLRFARMTGSSIAGRDAAAWVTDFLNGAYYRRPVAEREVDDLRLAFSVLTTYWYRKGGRGRLRIPDLPAFHRAYGRPSVRQTGHGPGAHEPRPAPRGSHRPDRRLVPGRPTTTTRAAAGGSGSRPRRKRPPRPGAAAQAREAREADPGERPARAAGVAHLRAGPGCRPRKRSSAP